MHGWRLTKRAVAGSAEFFRRANEPYQARCSTASVAAASPHVTGGRFGGCLDVGLGWEAFSKEFEVSGGELEEHGAWFDEYLEVVIEAWTKGGVSSAIRWRYTGENAPLSMTRPMSCYYSAQIQDPNSTIEELRNVFIKRLVRCRLE